MRYKIMHVYEGQLCNIHYPYNPDGYHSRDEADIALQEIINDNEQNQYAIYDTKTKRIIDINTQ